MRDPHAAGTGAATPMQSGQPGRGSAPAALQSPQSTLAGRKESRRTFSASSWPEAPIPRPGRREHTAQCVERATLAGVNTACAQLVFSELLSDTSHYYPLLLGSTFEMRASSV